MINERVPRQATANQKEHKGSSHICQKETSGWSPRPFRKISHGQKKLNFLEGLHSVSSAINLT